MDGYGNILSYQEAWFDPKDAIVLTFVPFLGSFVGSKYVGGNGTL